MNNWINQLTEIAAALPTGRRDPRALQKLRREEAELYAARIAGDTLGAIMEAGDVIYYAAKAVDAGLLHRVEAQLYLSGAAQAAGVVPSTVILAAITKMTLRAAPGNPKNDAAERAAVAAMLYEAYGWRFDDRGAFCRPEGNTP